MVTATPEELLQDYASAPYVVVVGRPDADNGTAGAIVADLLYGTGEALEAVLSGEQHMAVRYGPWAPTQTVIMLTEVGPSDALRTLSILKSMRMTVTDGSVHAEYRNPRACFLQDFGDTVRATDASVWTKLDDMATFNVTITRYDDTSAPVPLTADTGLEDDDLAMGRYLEVILGDEIWGDGVDLVTGGQVKVFYTIEDLDRTGDGDVNDTEDLNETTLRLYWLDEATGNWSLLHPDLDWVNETGLNTTDLEVHGRQYAGCIWAVVHRPLTLAVVGRDTTVPTIAGAGDDVEVDQGDTVTFNGTMSTGNGGIANLTWTFEYDGATVALYGPTPSFTFDLPGAYAVTLTVTDALDRTAQTTINVIVAEVFLPTIARTGDEKVAIVGDTVTFDGTASTGNGDIATYTWTFEYEGATVTLDGATPSHTFDLPGVYTVTLNVTDARDRWGMATMNVTVIEETEVLPTIARTGDDVEIDQGESVTFDGTASTGNGDIVAYEWTFEYDGSTVTLEGAEPSFTFDLPGEYNVTLNVTDALGHTGETTFMVTVGEMVPTIALPGDDLMVGKDDEVSFDGTASTGNGDIVAYRWTFGYDGATVTLEGAMPSFKFEIPGTYTVTLNVTDSKDRTGESTFTVTVREVLPTVAATGGDMEAKVGRQVAFDGTTSTGNGEIVQYNWTFLHDGQTVTLNGAMPVYTFEKPGEYVVTLTVTDSHGRTDDDTFTVKVAKEADGDDGGLSTTVITGIGIAIIIVIILLVALLGGRAGGSSRGTGRDEDEPEDGPVEAPYEPPNDLLTEDDLEVEVDEPDDIIEDGDADLEAEAEAPDDEPVVDDITDLLAELEEESKEKE